MKIISVTPFFMWNVIAVLFAIIAAAKSDFFFMTLALLSIMTGELMLISSYLSSINENLKRQTRK